MKTYQTATETSLKGLPVSTYETILTSITIIFLILVLIVDYKMPLKIMHDTFKKEGKGESFFNK